ncbi:hypothetical protein GGQ99_000977 [Aminobacter niigataensis]|uniref:2TM domain-containing protein n=1 Tax=Aminobacter niigataensis TaxID=83265 RepID=A0ABR6KXV1_9HYPH|nr:hypothetical protein [Aminobacter niigataensis]MBB4649255.1 hypothetical protein [Aminobacter niigataensis]
MKERVKKPGYMLRAVMAWCIFNTILFVTLGILVYLLTPFLDRWFVVIPILVGVIVSEWVIMAETIAPIVKEWIAQEEWVEEKRP